ncbi:MAG: hypothetical protein Q8N94_07295 [Methanoregula sp.]|nr:hypothetical protein [Methanoregula sp.]
MSVNAGDAGLALLVGAIGLIGGLLGNLIAGNLTLWRQLRAKKMNKEISTNQLLLEIILFLIAFGIIVFALITLGKNIINL